MMLEQMDIYVENSWASLYTHTKHFEMDHRLKCKIQNHKASRIKHNIIYSQLQCRQKLLGEDTKSTHHKRKKMLFIIIYY